MAQAKKGLGRGLSALIPTDMDFLAEVARGDFSVLSTPPNEAETPPPPPAPHAVSRETAESSAHSFPGAGTGKAAQVLADRAQEPEVTAEESSLGPGISVGESLDGVGSWGRGADGSKVLWVAPAEIEANPYQPRRTFDEGELGSLADSIREHGVLQPILVRPVASSGGLTPGGGPGPAARYQLIAGERRWRASQAAQSERVPVIVRAVSDQQALELAIIENVQRHDISALDAAIAYRRLAQEFGLSQEKIARCVGKSRSSIANTMRLLDLPPEAQQAIQDGAISEGHGRAILLAPGDGARRAALRATLRGQFSVRQTEEFAGRIARQARRDTIGEEGQDQLAARTADSNHASTSSTQDEAHSVPDDADAHLEEELQRALSCKVQVKRRRSGGQVVLFAADSEQMQRITETLRRLSP